MSSASTPGRPPRRPVSLRALLRMRARPTGDLVGAETSAAEDVAAAAPVPAAAPARRGRLRRASAALLGLPARLRHRWRSSLQLRVAGLTFVLALVVVTAFSYVLLENIREGLLSAKVEVALTASRAAQTDALQAVAGADVANDDAIDLALGQVTRLVASPGRAQAARYEVVIIPPPSGPGSGSRPSVTNDLELGSVPESLRDMVVRNDGNYWTYTLMRYRDGRSEPGLVVGQRLPVVDRDYQMFLLFPLDSEARTLTLVQQSLGVTSFVLVLLVVGLVVLVTRLVTTPLRNATASAERLASGRLDERMAVRGEDEIARLATAFNEMADSLQDQIDRLEGMSRLQQRFVSDVSHELRTPLTTVRMAADVIHDERETFDPLTARSAELLVAQLDRFEAMLADLLEISRHDAGAAVLDISDVDIEALAVGVLEASQPLLDRLGVPAQVIPCTPGPVVVEGDARRLDRVLRNLVVNAAEHAEGRPLEIYVGADVQGVAVNVVDHGVGMSPEDSARVFDRFWRADPARTRTTGGTGLGLSIAKEDVHLHGGWLQAVGREGLGSQFRLTLPRVPHGPLEVSPVPFVDLTDPARRSAARGAEAADGDPATASGPTSVALDGDDVVVTPYSGGVPGVAVRSRTAVWSGPVVAIPQLAGSTALAADEGRMEPQPRSTAPIGPGGATDVERIDAVGEADTAASWGDEPADAEASDAEPAGDEPTVDEPRPAPAAGEGDGDRAQD